MSFRGRPILGAIAGLFLGAFVAVDLAMFGVRPLDELGVYGLPAAGLVLGLLLGLWGPLGRGRAARKSGEATPAEPATAPATTPSIGTPSPEAGAEEAGEEPPPKAPPA